MNPLLAGGLILVLRVMNMSVDSVRVISMVKGYRLRSALLGTVEAGIFIFAISQVLSSPMQWQQMVGYALGFGVGTFTGSTIAGRLASNFTLLRCLTYHASIKESLGLDNVNQLIRRAVHYVLEGQ
jgi:uncharacterized protein YebE (UPF0316 family)